MRKGMPQVAKSSSKWLKNGTRWAHFGTAGLTFEASCAIFGVPQRLFADFYVFFLSFCVKSIIFSAIS